MKSLKRTLWLIPILAATLWTTACSDMLSVEPLASDSNTVFDPALLGVWTTVDSKNNDAVVSVRQGDEQSYEITWSDVNSDPKYRLDARLVQINGERILDVTPHDAWPGGFYVPGHAFLCINSRQDEVTIQFLDSEWLQEQVTQSKLLSHSTSGHAVITGTTAEMQDFFTQFGLNEQARSEPITLRRMK
jgi:hypothetical protein